MGLLKKRKYPNWKSKISVRQFVIFISLTIVLALLSVFGIGFIGWPFFDLSLLIIPVMLGYFLDGRKMAIALGLVMGLYTLCRQLFSGFIDLSTMTFAWRNPFVAILPQIIGVIGASLVNVAVHRFPWLVKVSLITGGAMACYEVSLLIGVYLSVGETFATLHDLPVRNLVNILVGTGIVQWVLLSVMTFLLAWLVCWAVNRWAPGKDKEGSL